MTRPTTLKPTEQLKPVTVRVDDKQRKTLQRRGGGQYIRRVLDQPVAPGHEVKR